MSESHPPESSDSVNYERQDVHVGPLTGSMVGLMVFMLFSVIISYGIHKGFLYLERSRKVDVAPLANYRRTPPEPRLQVDPTADLLKFHAAETVQLESYGWVDPQQGVVRIPIDRAKQLLLDRGL